MSKPDRFKTELHQRLLSRLAPWRDAAAWRIAFSGGLDSTVLLHLLAELSRHQRLPPLTAIHVHHGLQAVAASWPGHCRQVCQILGVPLQVVDVQVESGASLEQAARDARYAAFDATLQRGEVLLTAQHRDDQAETLMFRLLRGAGVRGLAAMPAQRRLGHGHLFRPLLDESRALLERYAREEGLSWIEDPSNKDSRFSRNYLRNHAMPMLTERWPQAIASMARSAAHLAEAQGLLDELAVQDLSLAQSPCAWPWLELPSLELAPLEVLSPARQRNALRHWLAPLTRLPDSDHWAGWDALRDAGPDGRPIWRLGNGQLHRAEGRIWWLSGIWLKDVAGSQHWSTASQPLHLPGNGMLQILGEVPRGGLHVHYRQGGEVLDVPDRGRRDLKRLLNEKRVPVFLRGRLPLLYRGEQLLAVANLPGLDADPRGDWRLHWLPPTNDHSLR
ncbi:tRNA lysidine(34) synthetase TilS [Pseudomonas sp. GD03842]|uniref:tRNA lysidine(34) synthetase TilS n=1 Tax=Pseudomonas sp. GD03842 TaxID=2975385 RepID=UPI0024486EDC|nr:tRNA lysidine(34) synthetase TilS [Pseudomonas sp. GD03842]MDH0747543.1 tRNA lysidine(34) synthetase TilS [Pseudomonas sp. GD03842]